MNEEITLITAAKNGDASAFRALLEMHYDFIYKVSYKFSGNKEAAENNAHDVCIKLSGKLASFNFRSSFQTWLYSIILNVFRDNYRKEKVNSKYIGGDIPDDIISPELSQTDRLMAKQIYSAVLSLPPKLKDAFLMVYMQDFSHMEAGKRLGCSEGTISWRINLAKKKIREILEGKDRNKLLLFITMITTLMITGAIYGL